MLASSKGGGIIRKGKEKDKHNDDINDEPNIDNNDQEMAELVNDLNHENNFHKILNGPAILIVKVDKKYLENPAKLKPELDKILPNIQILQVKTTLNNNLFINFPDNENLNNFKNNEVIFVNNNRIILDKERKIKKIKFEIIIKGLSHEISQEFTDEIENAGIEKISKFSNRDNYKMIKGECKNKEVMNELIKNGLFINSNNLLNVSSIERISIISSF